MNQVPVTLVKQMVGKPVHLVLADGAALVGHLLSCDGRSLWLVAGGEDLFIPVGAVAGILADPVPVHIPG